MKVTILGCGPAGLLAAHAASQAQAEVKIVSKKRPSYITGAQFLHEPIPPFHWEGSPDASIVFSKVGTEAGYASKVYGDPNTLTSWRAYDDGFRPGWSMLDTYQRLWDIYESFIEDRALSEEVVAELEKNGSDLYLTSVPAPLMCKRPHDHHFDHKTIWVREGNGEQVPENTIIYNGRAEDRWHRGSNLFDHTTFEFAIPTERTNEVTKPLKTNCDCRSNWMRVGRYGRWERGVLTHSAYTTVEHALHKL